MAEIHSLTINGHELIALEYNQHLAGTPVIFLHGIANSVYLWEPVQLPYVNDCVHWLSLSLPGHYPARLPDGFKPRDLTPQMMAEVMAEAVRQLSGGKPVQLIGYSTGAYASLCIAHQAPELVDRMLLLDGFANGVWGAGLRMPQLVANLKGCGSTLFAPYIKLTTFSLMLTRFAYNLVGTDLKAMDTNPNTDAIIQSNWETVRAGNPAQLYPYFRYMFHTDISDWLPEIETETLIVHGSVDRVVIPEHAEHMHNLLPHSQLEWIMGSGHVPFLERQADFERIITTWLQQ